MRPLNSNINVDNSDLVNFPDGRLKDNTGSGDGTPVNEKTNGDWFQAIAKLMRLYGITPNGLPDNETNGYQIIEALSALASKNDYVITIGSSGGDLTVPVKIGAMLLNESIVCKSAVDVGAETNIVGSDTATLPFVKYGVFKTGESVRLTRTVAGIDLVRISDQFSLDAMTDGFLYLKKASQAEEDAGAIETKATTPLVNKTTFTKRVIGSDSVDYLATAIRNGLYPKEHFAIVAAIGENPIKNKGFVSGIDVGNTSGALAAGGDVVSASATSTPNETVITVNVTNAMSNTNYLVQTFVESQGSIGLDNDIDQVVFKPISVSQFQISLKENAASVQSLKIHFKVEQL